MKREQTGTGVLRQSRSDPSAAAILPETFRALSAILNCNDAEFIARIPGADAFEVVASIGGGRDWISFQATGPQVLIRPLRAASRTIGLFVGIPDAGAPELTGDDRHAATATLTLAAIAVASPD